MITCAGRILVLQCKMIFLNCFLITKWSSCWCLFLGFSKFTSIFGCSLNHMPILTLPFSVHSWNHFFSRFVDHFTIQLNDNFLKLPLRFDIFKYIMELVFSSVHLQFTSKTFDTFLQKLYGVKGQISKICICFLCLFENIGLLFQTVNLVWQKSNFLMHSVWITHH